MNAVFTDFQTRSKEVEGYFHFVLRLANEEISLQAVDASLGDGSSTDHEELLKTFKATCYLLLYNLVESTMRNAVEAIFEELRSQGISFDDCREELKLEILKNFRKRNVELLLPKLLSLAKDVIHETFERSENFSGNLDARSIRETASRYGFSPPVGNQFNMLRTVKDLRNDLAHGVKSFAEVGREATASDLERARDQTVKILDETIRNIDDYLRLRQYLSARGI
jgi:hypothetical protein